jgi:hypothetical protein
LCCGTVDGALDLQGSDSNCVFWRVVAHSANSSAESGSAS